MIKKLDSEKIAFIAKNIDREQLKMYLSVKKDEVEYFSAVMSDKEAEELLSALAKIEFKADVYEDAQKEIARLIYFLIRDEIEEDEREVLLKPFFPDMSKRYEDFLSENLVPHSEMNFARLLENLSALEDENIGGFESLDEAVYLDRTYLLRFIATLEDKRSFASYLEKTKDKNAKHFRKFFKYEKSDVDEGVDYEENYNALLRRLNLVLIALYLEHFSKAFYYLKREDLNMYQGFEFELSTEEAIAALQKLSIGAKFSAEHSSFFSLLKMKIKGLFK